MEGIGNNYLQGLSIERWMKDTYIALGHRGEALQALDRAIRDYCVQSHDNERCLETTLNLQDAFARWAMRKAGDYGIVNPASIHDPRKMAIWTKDRRNHSGAMTKLYDALYTDADKQRANMTQQNLTRAEREAIAYLEECTRKLAAKLFAGKTCEFRFLAKKASVAITQYEDTLGSRDLALRSSLDRVSASGGWNWSSLISRAEALIEANSERAHSAYAVASSVKDGFGGVHEQTVLLIESASNIDMSGSKNLLSGAADRASTFLMSALLRLVPDRTQSGAIELFCKLNSTVFAKTVSSLMPVLGPVQSIGESVMKVAKGQLQIRSAKSIETHRFTKDESAALAIEAVTRLMREQGESKRKEGLRQAASSAANTIISAIPGAQAVGAGVSLASALVELLFLFKGFMEDKATRDAMTAYLSKIKDPETSGGQTADIETGRELFTKFPLLGAYWVMLADTSSIIGICAEDLTASNFMEQVEKINRTHLQALRSAAADLIAESSLVIPELSAHRLIANPKSDTPYSSNISSLSESIKRSIRGLSVLRRAKGLFPPPTWKSRVVGISSDEYLATLDVQGKG
jgi:hypothetical protein